MPSTWVKDQSLIELKDPDDTRKDTNVPSFMSWFITLYTSPFVERNVNQSKCDRVNSCVVHLVPYLNRTTSSALNLRSSTNRLP